MKNTIYTLFYCFYFVSAILDPVLAEEADHKHEHHNEEKHLDYHEDHDNSGEHQTKHIEHEEHGDHEEAIKLSPNQLKEFDIVIKSAGPGVIEKYVTVPGEIVVNQDTLSHISARFPGIVKQVKKRVGDSVKKDEVLAIIESNESLSLYSIKSLIDGTVIHKHATIGELLREEDVAYTVANLNTVWLNLSIYQSDLSQVKPGQEVVVSQGHGQRQAHGVITYLSPIVNEDTRTATARVIISNSEGAWTPGIFVTATIKIAQGEVNIRIPRTAIQTVENKQSVFIDSNGEFKATPIVVGKTNDKFAEVLSGLTVGERYVAKNSFTLKAELLKESFGDGHNH